MNLHTAHRGIEGEASRRGDRVTERLPLPELIDGRADDLSRYRDRHGARRNEHDVPALQPYVVSGDAPEQIRVPVERAGEVSAAPHLDVTERPVLGRPAGRVQRRENRARACHLVGAGAGDLSNHEDLDGSYLGDRYLELCRGASTTSDPGIHPAQPRVELILELAHGQVGHVDLPDLRDNDETLAGHFEAMGQLHVAGEDQDQHVARAQAVVLVDRPRHDGIELGAAPPEHVQPEDLEFLRRLGQGIGAQGIGDELGRVGQDPE